MSTGIQWTDDTFNCITGCTRVSEGCRHCYAEKLSAGRLRYSPKYQGVADHHGGGPRWTGQIRLHPELLLEPLKWRPRPSARNKGGRRMVFVNNMSDTFHPDVPFEFLDKLFATFAITPHVTWQVLTKRPERMREYFLHRNTDGFDTYNRVSSATGHLLLAATPPHTYCTIEDYRKRDCAVWFDGSGPWPLPNAWLGTSIEDPPTANVRIPYLLDTPAAVRFVSYEPALGPVDFTQVLCGVLCPQRPEHRVDVLRAGTWNMPTGLAPPPEFVNHGDMESLDWVIVGGESGHHARPFDIGWAYDVIEQCKKAEVACFIKQVGSNPKGLIKKPTDSHGGCMSDWPEDLRVRQWPREVV